MRYLQGSSIAYRTVRDLRTSRVFTRFSSTHAEGAQAAVIFSGIQPTGVPHLGNYLGAIQNWVRLQHTSGPDDTLLYSIVGWHALTLPQNSRELFQAKFDTAASLLALGIDPERSILFQQSDVLNHLELSWYLTCLTPMGKLKRMTTWKGKLATVRNANSEDEVDDSMLNLGLFSYPVLQAADILAYLATHVPVGEDQMQHLELSRDLASIYNRRYSIAEYTKPFFPLPQAIYTPCPRILSLRDPTQKMSKSAPDPNSRIMLTDDAESIAKKIRSAVTDSTKGITYDPVNRPGVANLLTILDAFRPSENEFDSPSEALTALASQYANKGTGDLKKDVAEAIVEGWRRPRAEFERLRADRGYLAQILLEGSHRAESLSKLTMDRVRQHIGLSDPDIENPGDTRL
ncbi:hypothetical protein M422DRAFT_36082 [Sphaerobolus stellatus SS14]|uniref:Tryptophan--tRNA ligase, mitochondrial n=1 Tax=Sphaerobolus stellatus (strain SS14) TaxID=990650 RepID=A0A0C9URG1_SPHS4|nr:hypothetical protein M422DRAFT_36082 [Sphaerobolus stellatus SS14]